MNRQDDAADRLHDLVFGTHEPTARLLKMGRFPDAWVDDYCSTLAEARVQGEGDGFWPRRLFRAVHFASCYLNIRYNAWSSGEGATDPATEDQVGRLQLESEFFLWGSAGILPQPHDPSAAYRQGIVEEPDANLVTLCFENNPVLTGTRPADDADVEAWTQQYLTALSAVSEKWHSTPYLWKWLALAVRFASFYLDLALIPPEVRHPFETQPGLDPARIRATVERLRGPLGDSSALPVIDLWMRTTHLRRDSSGFPCLIKYPAHQKRPCVRIRTPSECFILAGDP